MNVKIGMIVLAILSLTAIGVAEIIDASHPKLDQVPLEFLVKARTSLVIICFVTDGGQALQCTDVTVRSHGQAFSGNKAGFGGALQVENHVFGKDVLEKVKAGKTSWEQQINSVLSNPANKRFNVVVWSGSTTNDTGAYLAAMDNLKKNYLTKQFVYMTGTLDAEKIRSICRQTGRYLLDAAVIDHDRAQAEWYLWARLAGWREGSPRTVGEPAIDLVEDKVLKELLAKGARVDEAGDHLIAYVHYREAVRRAEALSRVLPFELRKQISDARGRMRSLEIQAQVKRERKAGKQLTQESPRINRDIEDAIVALEKIADNNPGTYTGQKAEHIADELSELRKYIH